MLVVPLAWMADDAQVYAPKAAVASLAVLFHPRAGCRCYVLEREVLA